LTAQTARAMLVVTAGTRPERRRETGMESNRPWCEESGHKPNPKHGPDSFCALAWELGITKEDNPDEWRELKRLTKGA
jgi:hypothetical protein